MEIAKNVMLRIRYKIASLRASWYRLFMKRVGSYCEIFDSCRFYNLRNISLGNSVLINYGCEFEAVGGPITIGHYVMIGPEVKIMTLKRDYTDYKKPMYFQPHIYNQKVVINDDVWIGSRALIMPNVTIGRGAIVGAGSVVTRDVAPFSIVAGVPAKPIGERFDKRTQKRAQSLSFEQYREPRILH